MVKVGTLEHPKAETSVLTKTLGARFRQRKSLEIGRYGITDATLHRVTSNNVIFSSNLPWVVILSTRAIALDQSYLFESLAFDVVIVSKFEIFTLKIFLYIEVQNRAAET